MIRAIKLWSDDPSMILNDIEATDRALADGYSIFYFDNEGESMLLANPESGWIEERPNFTPETCKSEVMEVLSILLEGA